MQFWGIRSKYYMCVCMLHHIQPKHYTPCLEYLGFVKKCYLCWHTSNWAKTEDNLQCWWLTSCILLCWTTSKPSPEYTGEVTARMISDHITDLLITQLGMFMFRQYGLSQRQLISSHISTLSQLMIKLRRSTGKTDLTRISCKSTEHFDNIVDTSAYLPDGNKAKCLVSYFKMQSICHCQNWLQTL